MNRKLLAALLIAVALIAATPAPAQQVKASTLTLNVSNPPNQVPSAAASIVGNPGPRTLYYWIVTNATSGASTPAGPFTVTNAPNNLTGSRYVQVSWTAAPSAVSYDVLRTTSPTAPTGACNCAVATGVIGTSTNDQSETLSAYTVTSADAGALAINVSATSPSAGTSLLQCIKPNGTSTCDFDKTTANQEDLALRTAPSNPPAGYIRLYADSGTGLLSCLTPSGSNCNPGGGGGGSGYQTLQLNGVNLTQRTVANFSTEFAVTDNPGATRTDVSINSIAPTKLSSTTGSGAAVLATNPTIPSYMAFTAIGTPAAPGAGIGRCYYKTSNQWACIDSSGHETMYGGQQLDITGYGAKCDGTTDDTAAMNAAVADAYAGKGYVWIPPSTNGCPMNFVHSNANSFLAIRGVYGKSIVKAATDGTAPIVIDARTFTVAPIYIDGLNIVGVAGHTNTDCILFRGGYNSGTTTYVISDHHTLRNIQCDGGSYSIKHGFEVRGRFIYGIVDNFYVKNASGDGFHITQNDTDEYNGAFNANTFSNIATVNTKGKPFSLDYTRTYPGEPVAQNIRIINSTLETGGSDKTVTDCAGVYAKNTVNLKLSGVYFESNCKTMNDGKGTVGARLTGSYAIGFNVSGTTVQDGDTGFWTDASIATGSYTDAYHAGITLDRKVQTINVVSDVELGSIYNGGNINDQIDQDVNGNTHVRYLGITEASTLKYVTITANQISAARGAWLYVTNTGTINQITGGILGQRVVVQASQNGATILANAAGGTGQILNNGGNITLAQNDAVLLHYDGSRWIVDALPTSLMNSTGFSIPAGKTYQINGAQIGAAALSNGVTGSGTVVLSTAPLFPSYIDVATTAAPANPSAGNIRLYGNSTTGLLACLTSSGGNCAPSGSGGTGTVTNTGALTAGAVMVGNGGVDSKVTGVTIDASNNMQIPGNLSVIGPITSAASGPTILATNVPATGVSTPASGVTAFGIDSVTKRPFTKDDAGTVTYYSPSSPTAQPFSLLSPALTDTYHVVVFYPAQAITIKRIWCASDQTVVINFYQVTEGTAFSGGTKVINTDLTCTSTSDNTDAKTFNAASVAARTPIMMTITSATSSPATIVGAIEFSTP